MMAWSLIMDVIVAALLAATIVYAIQLSRRLSVLRDDRHHLQELIKGLQKATHQAEEAVGGLRMNASDAGRALQDSVERATALKADLIFITEKAEAAADRLEAALRVQRDTNVAPPAPAAPDNRRRPRPEVAPAPLDAAGSHSRLATLLKQAETAAPMSESGRGRTAAEPTSRPATPAPREEAERLRHPEPSAI
jgi:hypothetical protein